MWPFKGFNDAEGQPQWEAPQMVSLESQKEEREMKYDLFPTEYPHTALAFATLEEAVRHYREKFKEEPNRLYVAKNIFEEAKWVVFSPPFMEVDENSFVRSHWRVIIEPSFEENEWCISRVGPSMGANPK
jgi:hypothetical protein